MSWKNSASRYGSLSIGIHWLMVLLFLAVYGTMEVRRMLFADQRGQFQAEDLAKPLEERHEVVATTGYFLIGLHTVAALYHRSIGRHNTLTRVLREQK